MIKKRGKQWYAIVSYRDMYGIKRKKFARAVPNTEHDAILLDAKLKLDFAAGKLPTKKRMTVLDLGKQFMDLIIKPHRSPSTAQDYQHALDLFNKVAGKIDARKLTSAVIQKWCNAEQRRVKPTTARDYYNVINNMLNRAVKWNYIPINPCNAVEPPKYNDPNSHAYSQAETETILDFTAGSEVYIFVLLGALVGLRSAEMCGLTPDAVDFKKMELRIDQQLVRIPKDDPVPEGITPLPNVPYTKKGKTIYALKKVKTPASQNTVALPDIVAEELRRIEKQKLTDRLKFGPAYIDTPLLITEPDGHPYEPNRVLKIFHAAIKAHNLATGENVPSYRVHDLRHTAATLMLASHIDVKIVSRGLRHKNSNFTRQTYQHVLDDMQKEPAIAMNTMFPAKKDKAK